MKDIYSPSAWDNDDGEAIPMPAPSADNAQKKTEFDDGFSSGFYGSYGEAMSLDPVEPPVLDFSVPEIKLPSEETAAEDLTPPAVFPDTDPAEASVPDMPSVPGFSFAMPEEDLSLPDMPLPVADSTRTEKKSMGYEATVKIKNARHAERDEKRINEPIKKGDRPNYKPRAREFEGIASGTAHVSGGLPELKDDQMYVAVTPKELRLLKSRRMRGLGVFATFCLAIIAAFCIWNYVRSFADPLIGKWKGDITSLGVEALAELSNDRMSSTWEFSDSGSLYVNIVLNDTPVSLSGSYLRKTGPDGEQLLLITLTNPMDNTDFSLEMYYNVTGEVLELIDTEGTGAQIDLYKE